MPRGMARTLACLSSVETALSVYIEGATGLRQPEVSIAVKQLMARGWISRSEMPRRTKGRPVHIYRLAVPFRDIVAAIAAGERRKMRESRENLARLKALSADEGGPVVEDLPQQIRDWRRRPTRRRTFSESTRKK